MEPLTLLANRGWLGLVAACLVTLTRSEAQAAAAALQTFCEDAATIFEPATILELFKFTERSEVHGRPVCEPRLLVTGKLDGPETLSVCTLLGRYGCRGERWQIAAQPPEVVAVWQQTGTWDYILFRSADVPASISRPNGQYVRLTTTTDPGIVGQSITVEPKDEPSRLSIGQRLFIVSCGPGNWSH